MSRKLRKEIEQVQNVAKEQEEEVNLIELQIQKIFSPLVWKIYPNGIRVQDLKENYFDDVLKILEEFYLEEDILCRNVHLTEDEVSKKSYLDRIVFSLKDRCSLIAIDENNNEEIAGFLILRPLIKENFGRIFSSVQFHEGESHEKIVNFYSFINRRVDIYKEFNCTAYLRYYLLCVRDQYRHKSIGFQLMRCAFHVARSLGISVVMGIFETYSLQKLASRIGMRVFYEINYNTCLDKNKQMLFCDPGPGNYTCALMAGEVPEHLEPKGPPPPPAKEEKDVSKITRIEKRKIKMKQLKEQKEMEDAKAEEQEAENKSIEKNQEEKSDKK